MAELEEELKALGVEGACAAAGALSTRADDYTNNVELEQAWAMKAIKYAETHFKLIQSVDAATLRLTRNDDAIFQGFVKKFQDMPVDIINPEDLKSTKAKQLWGPFCMEYEGAVDDYNFGTLLRLDCSRDYTEENTVLVPRIQFLSVEIARNRLGLNSVHFSAKS